MNPCEMCGKTAELRTAEVEGVELRVCPGCVKYGTVRKTQSWQSRKPLQKTGPELTIVSDYASLLRNARASRNMSQEEFAKLLQERESAVAKWEQGSLKPSIDAGRRVEKILGIRLVVQEAVAHSVVQNAPPKKSDEFTLGDFIKVRKRK